MRCKDKLKLVEILNVVKELLAEALKIKTKEAICDDFGTLKRAFNDLKNLNKQKADFLKWKSF